MKQVVVILFAAISFMACKSGDKKAAGSEITSDSIDGKDMTSIIPPDTANFTSIQWLDSTYLDLGKQKEGKEIQPLPFSLIPYPAKQSFRDPSFSILV